MLNFRLILFECLYLFVIEWVFYILISNIIIVNKWDMFLINLKMFILLEYLLVVGCVFICFNNYGECDVV